MIDTDKVTHKRLIYVKRLHMHAQEHVSHGTEFDKMIAIHHFDNAIELLLKCVAAKYEISLGDPFRLTFHKLWKEVSKEYRQRLGSELPKKTEILQLHRIRSDVQHWGVSSFSLEAVKDFDEYTHDFMQSILKSVFDLKYNELFLSSLVKDKRIRALLTDAERYFADEKWKEAIFNVSIAFAAAKEKAQRRRYLPTVPRIPLLEDLGDIDERVGILALGLDIEEYKRFKKNTPVVMYPLRDEPVIQWRGESNFTRENALFCFNFALNSILRWDL